MKHGAVWLIGLFLAGVVAGAPVRQSVAAVARQKADPGRRSAPGRVFSTEDLRPVDPSSAKRKGKAKAVPAGRSRRRVTTGRAGKSGRDSLAWADELDREAKAGRKKLSGEGQATGRRIRAENKAGRDRLVQEAKDERREELNREIPFGQTTNSFQRQLDDLEREKKHRPAKRPGRGPRRKQ